MGTIIGTFRVISVRAGISKGLHSGLLIVMRGILVRALCDQEKFYHSQVQPLFGERSRDRVIITFWWKADSIQVCTDPSVMCKGLFFLVDGKTQLTCNSADWKEVRFPLADGLHRVEWIFKPRSDQKGIGWLDNVSIAPAPVTAYTNHSLTLRSQRDGA